MIAPPKGFDIWSPTKSIYDIEHGDHLIIITLGGYMQRVIASRLHPFLFEFVNPETKKVVLGIDHEKIIFYKKETHP